MLHGLETETIRRSELLDSILSGKMLAEEHSVKMNRCQLIKRFFESF